MRADSLVEQSLSGSNARGMQMSTTELNLARERIHHQRLEYLQKTKAYIDLKLSQVPPGSKQQTQLKDYLKGRRSYSSPIFLAQPHLSLDEHISYLQKMLAR